MWLIAIQQTVGNLPYELTSGNHVIGRSRSCDLRICEVSVSRQHARIWLGGQSEVVIEDLKSKNGTFVDDSRIGRVPLKPETILRVGGVRLLLSGSAPISDEGSFEDTRSSKGDCRAPLTNLPVERLTAAQRKVFELLVSGGNEEAIAQRLNRSINTIHVHIQAIFQKLGVHSRADLLATIIQDQARTVPVAKPSPNSRA